MLTPLPQADDPLPGRSTLGSFPGRCEHRGPQGVPAQPVLATEMRTRNKESPLLVHSSPGIFSPPEVNSTRGLKTLACGQRFSDSGGSLGVHPRHRPITLEICRGSCLWPRAPAPFQGLCRLRPEQTFAKARGCSNPGRGPGGSSRPGRAARCIRCPTGGVGGEQLVAPKAPGSDVAAARGGKGGTGGPARLTRPGRGRERLGSVFTSGAALRG